MPSSFFEIETMRRAITAQRTVLDVIGHNIANAATPGYSRQRAVLKATAPFSYPGVNAVSGVGQLGTGVMVDTIERVRDIFVDNQMRLGTSSKGQLAVEQSALQRVEQAFLEPSTAEGLTDVISSFYDAWQDLAVNPDNLATRQVVITRGQNFVDVANTIDQQLRDIRSDLNAQLREDVKEVNRILNEIAGLNSEIAKVLTNGATPNDLMDTRDVLLDDLSKYMDITVGTTDNDMISIHVGSRQLLWDTGINPLSDGLAWDHPSQQTQTPQFSDVSAADFSMLADFARGELKGILNARDVYVPEVQQKFQEFVSTFMDEVNNAHSQGFGLQAFARNLALSTTSDIVISPNAFAVADNSVTLTGVDNIAIGDIIRFEETDTQQGDGLSVRVTDIQGGRVYFETLDTLTLQKTRFLNDPLATYQVDSGAEVYKIENPKNNFFNTLITLPSNFKGDVIPDYRARMTSIQLDENINANTTLKELGNIFGVDITDDLTYPTGLAISIDNKAKSAAFSDNTTFGMFLQRINEIRPPTSDGKKIELKFDEVNHRLILSGGDIKALSELGGEFGSALNLFRVIGFEGQAMTGFQLTPGSTLDGTVLSQFGVSDGYFMVDGVVLQADSAISIQNNMDNWNAALNVTNSSSDNTQFMYDPVERRMKIVSNHQFSVRDAMDFGFPAPFTKSNFLTVMGYRDNDGDIGFSTVQQQASITTSDIGARITVNDDLIGDVNLIATARNEAGTPGDNAVAVAVGLTRSALVLNDTGIGVQERPSVTLEEYFDAAISGLGTTAQRVNVDLEVVDKFIEYYTQRRSEISGVSIDEELTKMLEAQYAFAAASRMINVADEMLDRIINGMGIGGR